MLRLPLHTRHPTPRGCVCRDGYHTLPSRMLVLRCTNCIDDLNTKQTDDD